MAFRLIRKLSSGITPYFSLGLLLVLLAYLLSAATQDSSKLNDLFLYLFGLGLLCLFLLAAILARGIFRLYRDFQKKAPGSRLTLKLVSLFVLLIVGSTSIVYGFSVHFLQRGINSWFNVKVEQALEDSLELSRSAFGIRMRTLLRQTRMMAGVLSEMPSARLSNSVHELVQLSGALELGVWTIDGQLVVSSGENPAIVIPTPPDESIVRRLQQGEDYIGLDPTADDGLELRAAVMLPRRSILSEKYYLYASFPVNEHLSALGKNVQDAYTDYKELSYLRKPLVTIFTLTLSLIVFLTMLASIWFAVWISRRMVQPLQELAAGTQAVASGNYNTQLTASGHDEISFLVRSFNQMTQRLTQARNASDRSHDLLARQTSYLTTVLGSLSSGVITIDNDLYLRTANMASSDILGVNLQQRLESSLDTLGKLNENLHRFSLLIQNFTFKPVAWQQQLEFQKNKGRQTLMCRGTPLPSEAGWVIIFDDITALLQAQRNAAWGEVARRLAHEIKNPLTPIQLSAERLQHKYASLVPADQTETLHKLTDTIVHQVEAMKDMVNEFSDYARSPGLRRENVSASELIHEVLTLYQSHSNHQFTLLNSPTEIRINVDKNRMRQVLHNLLKNAIEASEEANKPVDIVIGYHLVMQQHTPWLEITITDKGPGFPQDMVDKLFEPYTTTKVKGTGLGLAIVKKIIEEHGGDVWAENRSPEGAGIIIRLPLEED